MAKDAWITITGTVMNDPTNRQVNNSTVLSMKVAVPTTRKQEGKQWPESDIYDVAVWGAQAERLMEKIKAKTKVWVVGSFETGSWKGRDDVEHQSLKIEAQNVKPLGGGSYNGSSGGNYTRNNNTAYDEEAPF